MPGDYIDECFKQKLLGENDCYVREIDGVPFLVHCHNEDKYACKVMSTHGLMVKVMYQRVGNEWTKLFTEAIANHNTSKHWIYDANQRKHAPFGLEDVWATQWWPHRQFTFICSVAEVNTKNSLARASNANAKHLIKLRKLLANEVIYNCIIESGGVQNSPIKASKMSRQSIEFKHELTKKPKYTAWLSWKCW